MSVCGGVAVWNVPSVGNRNQDNWRFQVKECIAIIAKQNHRIFFKRFQCFFGFETLVGSVLANQPTVHIVGVLAGRGSVAVAVAVGDR